MAAKLSDPEDLLPATDAGRVLGCSADNVRALTRRGVLLPAVVTSGNRPVKLYRRRDLEALAAKRNRPQRTPIPTERRAAKGVRS